MRSLSIRVYNKIRVGKYAGVEGEIMKDQNSSEKGKNIYERLLNIMTSITPALCFCIYIWIVGYNSREFILGSGVMIFISFLFGVFKPIPDRNESLSIDDLRERLINESDDDEQDKDILELMLSNMSEMREYYAISKKQANLAFGLSILFCSFGMVAIVAALPLLYISNTESTIITIIAGAVSEVFATTALFVHKSALKQLNIYYKALHENERFLSIVNLTNRLPNDKRIASIEKIIHSSLSDISISADNVQVEYDKQVVNDTADD